MPGFRSLFISVVAAFGVALSSTAASAKTELGTVIAIDRIHNTVWFSGTRVSKMKASWAWLNDLQVGDFVAVFYSMKHGKAVVHAIVPESQRRRHLGFTAWWDD